MLSTLKALALYAAVPASSQMIWFPEVGSEETSVSSSTSTSTPVPHRSEETSAQTESADNELLDFHNSKTESGGSVPDQENYKLLRSSSEGSSSGTSRSTSSSSTQSWVYTQPHHRYRKFLDTSFHFHNSTTESGGSVLDHKEPMESTDFIINLDQEAIVSVCKTLYKRAILAMQKRIKELKADQILLRNKYRNRAAKDVEAAMEFKQLILSTDLDIEAEIHKAHLTLNKLKEQQSESESECYQEILQFKNKPNTFM